jgi:YD repeat-containing protein
MGIVNGGIVIKRMFGVIFIVLVLQCIFSASASAQNQNPCVATSTWWAFDPIPPGWFYYAPYPGTFVYLIAAHTAAPGCAPAPECPSGCSTPPGAGGSSGGGSSGGGSSGGGSSGGGSSGGGPSASAPPNRTPFAGKPVFLTTGDTFIEETDVSLPGLGGGLTLQRTWNSIWPANEIASSVGLFGPNWRSSYEERVFMGGDKYLKYSRGDGSYWSFGFSTTTGAFVVVAPASAAAGLAKTASNWVLRFKNGERRQFSLITGLLTAIVDRNGNTTQLTYDGLNRLTTVTDTASRHLYFNYPNGSSYLVTSVTSDFGVTLSYAYDTQGRLSQVTEPDLTTITFTYNAQSQITQVTDTNGKVLESHTYDSSGRGLTSSQANGVNALTVTYPQ